MDKKTHVHLKTGQVWRIQVYRSGMSDNELVGHIDYVIKAKNSNNMWYVQIIKKEPLDVPVGWRTQSGWWKAADIRQHMLQQNEEEYKTLIVLYG